MSLDDLAPPTGRWTARRKEAVVTALRQATVTRDQVIAQLGVGDEELTGWQARLNRHGQAGLKTTKLQGFR